MSGESTKDKANGQEGNNWWKWRKVTWEFFCTTVAVQSCTNLKSYKNKNVLKNPESELAYLSFMG